MNCIALVTEGACDQEVISNILMGYLNDSQLDTNFIQPDRALSATEAHGGWGNLVKFLTSSDFKNSYQFNKYIVIHIDTDICNNAPISVNKYNEDGIEKDVDTIFNEVKDSLINIIGADFFSQVNERTIFAISVESIECWILPVFYKNNISQRDKTVNCLRSLNQYLKKTGYTIDPENKDPDYYNEITSVYRKKKDLANAVKINRSLALFINHLSQFTIECS